VKKIDGSQKAFKEKVNELKERIDLTPGERDPVHIMREGAESGTTEVFKEKAEEMIQYLKKLQAGKKTLTRTPCQGDVMSPLDTRAPAGLFAHSIYKKD
jgi:hypothetical protein